MIRFTTSMKALVVLQIVSVLSSFALTLVGALHTESRDGTRASNPDVYVPCFIAAAVLVAVFTIAALLTIYLSKNQPERKRQVSSWVAARRRVEAQYGAEIAEGAIVVLTNDYVRNDRQPDSTFLARFDSVQSDGSPASYALRANADGILEVFVTSGVEWVAVEVAA